MAPRAVASATVAFGLVNIPVKLFSAANPSAGISFRMLSKEGHKLKQQYVDPQNGDAVVGRDEIVKGYEFAKEQYVIFSEEEIRELAEKSTQAIEITEFVPEEKVPKVYYAKTYYLGPEKGGDRAYRLLAEAMTRCKRCALAKYAARGKQYLVLVAPMDGGLVMHQLHYPDEVQSFSEVVLPDVEVKEPEVALALQLIAQITSDEFHPEKYEDEVKKRIEAAIQRKIEGQSVTAAPAEAPKGQLIDLMQALKASLGQGSPPEAAAEGEGEGEGEGAPERGEKRAASKRAPRRATQHTGSEGE